MKALFLPVAMAALCAAGTASAANVTVTGKAGSPTLICQTGFPCTTVTVASGNATLKKLIQVNIGLKAIGQWVEDRTTGYYLCAGDGVKTKHCLRLERQVHLEDMTVNLHSIAGGYTALNLSFYNVDTGPELAERETLRREWLAAFNAANKVMTANLKLYPQVGSFVDSNVRTKYVSSGIQVWLGLSGVKPLEDCPPDDDARRGGFNTLDDGTPCDNGDGGGGGGPGDGGGGGGGGGGGDGGGGGGGQSEYFDAYTTEDQISYYDPYAIKDPACSEACFAVYSATAPRTCNAIPHPALRAVCWAGFAAELGVCIAGC